MSLHCTRMIPMNTQDIYKDKIQKESFKPSISDTIEHGFRHTWSNLGSMIILALIYTIIYCATTALLILGLGIPFSFDGEESIEPKINVFFLASAVIIMIVMSIFMMSVYRGFIVTDDQEKVNLSQFFSFDKNVVMGFATIIVSNIIMLIPVGVLFAFAFSSTSFESNTPVVVASILFIVIEILLAFYLSYSPFYSLEDGVGPFTAMKRSFEDVSQNPLYILGTAMLMFIISMIGSFFIITIIFVVPMSMVISAHIYRNISRHRNDDVVANLDRMYSPTVDPIEDTAMKDFNNVMKEKNTNNKM